MFLIILTASCQQTSPSKPAAMGRNTFHETKLVRDPSRPALDTCKYVSIASLGNLCLTNLTANNFSLIINLNLLSFQFGSTPPCPATTCSQRTELANIRLERELETSNSCIHTYICIYMLIGFDFKIKCQLNQKKVLLDLLTVPHIAKLCQYSSSSHLLWQCFTQKQ